MRRFRIEGGVIDSDTGDVTLSGPAQPDFPVKRHDANIRLQDSL